MGKLRLLSAEGDRTLVWDAARVEKGDPDALAAVREAQRIFEQQRRRGTTAFRVEPTAPARRLDQFDARADHVVMIPQVRGG